MADDTIRSFLVSLGFAADTSAAKKVVSVAQGVEDAVTKAAEAAATKRTATEQRSTKQQLTLKQQLGRLIEGMEQDRADRVDAIQKEQGERAAKRDAEDLKKATARRDALLKSTRALATGMTALVAGIAASVTGAATGLLWATDRAAKHFEKLAYAGQAAGSSAAGLSRFSYAASQLGTSVEDAQASVAAFGDNLKKLPAMEGMLKNMGIATRDANGHLKDAGDLAAQYIDHLKALPQLQREAQANAWGISEATTRAAVRPEFAGYGQEYDRIQGAVGANPNAAANGAIGFEQAMRRGFEIIGAVKTRVETALFDLIKPRLDDISKWVLDHGDAISNVVTSIAKGLTDLATAFVKSDVVQNALSGLGAGLERMAKYVASDAFKKDVQGFVNDVQALAKAIRSALEWLGILPSRGAQTALPDPEGAGDAARNSLYPFVRATLRGRSEIPEGTHGQAQEKLEGFRNGGQAGRGGGPNALRSEQQKANAAAIADELRKAGAPDEGTASVLGSMQTESSFNPRAHNDVTGGHTGLWQWDSRRWPKIRAWIEKQGGDPWDARWQTKAYIAEGRAKSGDAIYDNGETSAGFDDVMNSKGNLPKAVHGVQRSERFGRGEEGGRAAHAAKWMGHLPGASDIASSTPSTTSSSGPSEADYIAALQRSNDGWKLKPASQARLDQDKADQAIMAAYTKTHPDAWKLADKAVKSGMGLTHVEPGPEVRGKARTLKDTNAGGFDGLTHMTPDKPVKVEVTDGSAAKIGGHVGKALPSWMTRGDDGQPMRTVDYRDPKQAPTPYKSSFPAGTVPKSINPLADLKLDRFTHFLKSHPDEAHHYGFGPNAFKVPPSGVTPSMYADYDNRSSKVTNINHAPTFHITGGDPKGNMDHARMVADRGTRDLVRNMKSAEQ